MEENKIKKYSLNDILMMLSDTYHKVQAENDVQKKLIIFRDDAIVIGNHVANNDSINPEDSKLIVNKQVLIIDSIFKYIIKNKDIDPFCNKLVFAFEWQPYINRYNICLKQIKELLTLASDYVDANIDKWKNLHNNTLSDPMNSELLFRQCNSYEKIIACTLIRHVIELVLELQVLNNVKYAKTSFQKKSIYSYFEHFDKCKIDWKIKTLIINKCYKNKYFYYIDEIWNNIHTLKYKIWKKLLSNNIHNQEKNYPVIDYNNLIKSNEKALDYGEDRVNDLLKINDILTDIYFTLKDHVVFVENGELVLIVKDFEIMEDEQGDWLLKKASDYEFEEIPNESKEKLYDKNIKY